MFFLFFMHAARILRKSILGIALLVIAFAGNVACAQEEEAVERFLSRLGLVDLQAKHLEQVLDAAPAGEAQQRWATRLADLYSAQLIAQSDNKPAYDQVLQRIHRLMERVPAARTAALEVMLLQADYFRAESLMSKWLADRAEGSVRAEAAQILTRIAPLLDQRQQQLHTASEKLAAELDQASAKDDQAAKTLELNRLQTVAGRAAFFAAWANYYFGLSGGAGDAAPAAYVKARDIFRRILGVDEKYQELDASGLGLESIWRARTMVGLGLAESASGNLAGSLACFDLLDRSPAPTEVRELSPYWRVQSLLNAGRIDQAIAFAKPFVASFAGSASQGRVSFCVSLVRAGFGGPAPPEPAARELGMLGITGLIKLRQQSAVRQLVEKYQIPIDSQSGFHLAWLHGQQLLDAAEKSKRAEDYLAAEQALTAALATPNVGEDLAGASQCRYQLAWCMYKTEKWEAAAKTYETALEGLKATDSKTAAEAAWMAFFCYQSLAKSDRKFVLPAVNVLRGLQRDFPEHPYAKRAEYYIGKLQQAGLPLPETLANLERVPASAPDYLSARFDICQLLYDQWSKSEADRTTTGTKLLAAIDQFLAADVTKMDDPRRRLRVALMGVDVALNGTPPQKNVAGRFLDVATPLVKEVDNSAILAEYHYRSLQFATQSNNGGARRQHADWIVQNAAGSPFELPALIVAAKAVEDQLRQSTQPTREQLSEGQRLYERIVGHLGDDPAVLRSKKNAQVAVSRLAHFAAELGEHSIAAKRLSQLLAVFPHDQGYLRRAGLSAFQAGEYAAAIEHWRKLVGGLPKDSDSWYEAKYYQLACLAQLDREKAREALNQYRILYPDLGPPAWRGKFAELQRQVQ